MFAGGLAELMAEGAAALRARGSAWLPGSQAPVAGDRLSHEQLEVLLGVAFTERRGVLRLVAAGEGHHLVEAEHEAWWRSAGRRGARPLLDRLADLGIPVRDGNSSALVRWVRLRLEQAMGRLLARDPAANDRTLGRALGIRTTTVWKWRNAAAGAVAQPGPGVRAARPGPGTAGSVPGSLGGEAGGGPAGGSARGPAAPAAAGPRRGAQAPGGGLAGFLAAEHDAWLAWLAGGPETALEDARRQTGQALDGLPSAGKNAVAARRHLRAAVAYWRSRGHLEARMRDELGAWLKDLRSGDNEATEPVRRALTVMGIRWAIQERTGGNDPAVRVELAGRLREMALARRRGEAAAVEDVGQVRLALASRRGDGPDVAMLGTVARYWLDGGTLAAVAAGSGVREDLAGAGGWLEQVAAGERNPDPWIRAALGVMGLRWQVGPAPDRARERLPELLAAERLARAGADDAALEEASGRTNQALASEAGAVRMELTALEHLRNAVRYWRANGHVNALQSASGEDRTLAIWLKNIRARKPVPEWAVDALIVMGMKRPPVRAGLTRGLRERGRAGRGGAAGRQVMSSPSPGGTSGSGSGAAAGGAGSRSPSPWGSDLTSLSSSSDEAGGLDAGGLDAGVAGAAGLVGAGRGAETAAAGVVPAGVVSEEMEVDDGAGPGGLPGAGPAAGDGGGGVVLGPGWEWLDEARGIAFPAAAVLTGGTPTVRAEWRAARPGAGRGYAVHLPTGMIAVAGEPGAGPGRTVHRVEYGWVPYGPDLVHRDSGLALHGPDATTGRADPALLADPELGPMGDNQLNRDAVLTWLLDHGGLEGPVPGLVSGAGWQPLTDDRGGVQWVWNSPGVAARVLPPERELRRGTASGEGMRCLLDSLAQLMQTVLPAGQRAEMTTDFLRRWLDGHLPLDNEARDQLLAEEMVDVHSVLPVFTTMFQVRVQVFRHALTPGDFEWPGYQTIQPSVLQGPAVDQAGDPTPILRLYWRGHHFVPLFPPAAGRVLPAREPPGAGPPAVAAAWQARRDFRLTLAEVGGLLAGLDEEVGADIRGLATQMADVGIGIAVSVTAESAAAETGLMQDYVGQLTVLRDQLAQMTVAAPGPAGPGGGMPSGGSAGDDDEEESHAGSGDEEGPLGRPAFGSAWEQEPPASTAASPAAGPGGPAKRGRSATPEQPGEQQEQRRKRARPDLPETAPGAAMVVDGPGGGTEREEADPPGSAEPSEREVVFSREEDGPAAAGVRTAPVDIPSGATAAAGAVAVPAGLGPGELRLAPVFRVSGQMPEPGAAEEVTELDQTRRRRTLMPAQVQAPLGEDEDLRITGWDYVERRLAYYPWIDTQFPWRSPDDPQHRVYGPFARPDGSLDPRVTVVSAEMPPPLAVQAIAADPADDRLRGPLNWGTIRRQVADDVAGLVRAAITGQAGAARIFARILAGADLLPHEGVLDGQHGAFLTPDMLSAAVGDRPLLRNGRVLALYVGAVLDTGPARQRWSREHAAVAGSYTVDVPRPSRTGGVIQMGAEGYCGAAGFANTRLLPGQQATDQTYHTGVNTEMVAVNVTLTLPDGRTRRMPILALVALDNLYGDHNPAGMVITHYGGSFRISDAQPPRPVIKPEPGSPPPMPASPGPGSPAAGAAGADEVTDEQYLLDLPPGQPVATRSGYYLPAGPATDPAQQRDELAAAMWFPRVDGAVVWHLHLDPAGYIQAGDRALTPDQFYDEFVAPRLPPGALLVIVGCRAAAAFAPGTAQTVAEVWARRGDGPVLAADADVWATADGRVLAARSGFDAEGRPVLDTAMPGSWVLVRPGGQQTAGLGPDLLAVLRGASLPPDVGSRVHLRQAADGDGRPPPDQHIRWPHPGPAGPGREQDVPPADAPRPTRPIRWGQGPLRGLAPLAGEDPLTRATALLRGGPPPTQEQAARVLRLADRLRPAGQAISDAALLAWLGERTGVHQQDPWPGRYGSRLARRVPLLPAADVSLRRVFDLLDLGSQVLGEQADLTDLAGLRRLADLIRTAPGRAGGPERPVTLAELEAEYRAQHRLPAETVVTPEQLLALVALTSRVKAGLRAAQHRNVTRQHLAGLIAQQLARELDGPARLLAELRDRERDELARLRGDAQWRAAHNAGRQRLERLASLARQAVAADGAQVRSQQEPLPPQVAELPTEPELWWAYLAGSGWRHLPRVPGRGLFDRLDALIGDRAPAGRRLDDWLAEELARESAESGLRFDDLAVDVWLPMVAELTGPLVVLEPGRPPLRLGEGAAGEPRYLIRVGADFVPAWPPGRAPVRPTGLAVPLPAGDGEPAGGLSTGYQNAWLRLSGRQIVADVPGPPDGPAGLFAVLAGQAPEEPAGLAGADASPDPAAAAQVLRERVTLLLSADLELPNSRYRPFLPGDPEAVTAAILAGGTWDADTAALAAWVAGDYLDRPVSVIGPAPATSASYGPARGSPIELLLTPDARYLPVTERPVHEPRVEPLGLWAQGVVSAGPGWHARFGEAARGGRPFEGQFMVGLDVGPDGLLSLWCGGDVYQALDASSVPGLLGRHGWSPGMVLLVVAQRRAGDRVAGQAQQLADGLTTAVFVLAPGAGLGTASGPDGARLQAVDAGGAAANLWEEYETTSLRPPAGVAGPRWFRQEDGVIWPGTGLARIVLPGGFASWGRAQLAAGYDLLAREPVPGLFDLILRTGRSGQLGFSGLDGGFVPLAGHELPPVPDGTSEIRLITDRVVAAAQVAWLAAAYGVTVWVAPGAIAVRQGTQLSARSALSGVPVSWVPVLPDAGPAPLAGWYDTSSGGFMPRAGDAVIRLRSAGDDGAGGMVAVPQPLYYRYAALEWRGPRVPAGMFVVSVDISVEPPEFSVPDYRGGARSRPLRELAAAAREHGWDAERAIVVVPRYSGELTGECWERLTGAYAEAATAAGVRVYFPGRPAIAGFRYGDYQPAVASATGGPARWDHRGPGAGWVPAQPEFAQDVAGRLRDAADAGPVSLVMAAGYGPQTGWLRAGVASPTAAMMHERAGFYQQERDPADLGAFYVDVPLADGRLALAGPAGRERRPVGDELSEVAGLIRGAGWDESQTLYFLGAPATPQEYGRYQADVGQVAAALAAGAAIVAAPGAQGRYDRDRREWQWRGADGQAVGWQQIRPAGKPEPAEVLLGGLLAQVRPGSDADPAAQWLGWDPFGLRQPAPPPDFLAGYDWQGLEPGYFAHLLAAVDMTAPAPAASQISPQQLRSDHSPAPVVRYERRDRQWATDPDGELRGRGLQLLPQELVLPRLIHSIWFGGSLGEHGSQGRFRRNVAHTAAQHRGEGWRYVLWTDVPRQVFQLAEQTPPARRTPWLAEAWSMLAWARATGVMVINVHEVFSAGHPMLAYPAAAVAMAAQTPIGYTAASDIVRMEISRAFGGLYTDGDNFVGDGLEQDIREALTTSAGFACKRNGNDVIASPAGHPFTGLYLEAVTGSHRERQEPLLDLRRSTVKPRRIWSGWNPAGQPTGGAALRPAYSAIFRSWTRGWWPTLYRFGIRQDLEAEFASARRELTHSFDDPIPPVGVLPLPRLLDVAKGVVSTLLRHLVNRDGDLFLILVAPVIAKLAPPDRTAVWRASLRFLACWPQVMARVRTATVLELADDGTEQTRVDLPPELWELLGIDPAQIGDQAIGHGARWLGSGLIMPASLLPPASPDATVHPGRP